MKKRLKSLLALCMAGIMMFAMTTGIASADEMQTTSKIYTYDNIDSGTAYYPGDIVTPESINSSSGCKDFFVVKYYVKKNLDSNYLETLNTHVFSKEGYMKSDDLKGVYRYWEDVDSHTVLCNYTGGTWSVFEDEELMRNLKSKHSFTEYTRNPDVSGYDPKYDTGVGFVNPVCNAFYSFGYGDADENLYGSCALKLPSVDELFGEGYEFGYHYSLNKKRSAAWNVGGNYSDNTPSGICPVNADTEGNLIDIIYGKETQTEETQTEQGGRPISKYSYSTIKDALLIEAAANKYTVDFDANDGSAISSETDIEWKDKVLSSISSDPTKAGHFFNGWKCVKVGDTELTNPIDVDKNATYGDIMTAYAEQTGEAVSDRVMTITLQAQWVKDGEYTVEYDTDGGTAAEDKTGVKWTDKVLADVADPVKDGFTFTGWKYGETDVTADTTYAELAGDITVKSLTLKARYDQEIVPGTEPSDTDKTSKTGDDMNIALLMTLLILSGCGIAGAGLYRRNHVK